MVWLDPNAVKDITKEIPLSWKALQKRLYEGGYLHLTGFDKGRKEVQIQKKIHGVNLKVLCFTCERVIGVTPEETTVEPVAETTEVAIAQVKPLLETLPLDFQ